jgi:hypothetical protein
MLDLERMLLVLLNMIYLPFHKFVIPSEAAQQLIEPTCSSPEFAWLADVFRVDGWGWRPKVEINRSLGSE